MPVRIELESSSNKIKDLGDFCIVEKLQYVDVKGNSIKHIAYPFSPKENPEVTSIHDSIWGISQCKTVELNQSKSPYGGIKVTASNRASFIDSHGTVLINEINSQVDPDRFPHLGKRYNAMRGVVYVKQEFYWYKNGLDSQLQPLENRNGQPVTMLVKRSIDSSPNPPNPFVPAGTYSSICDTKFFEAVELFDTTGGGERLISKKRVLDLGCGLMGIK
ncbi:hypothetical protein K9N68_16765 [Kovacikia minuta CCNUW1]|uniref:hypothetical protein n=1 Tax=Kovacikia minuta TaxID=2931930 RepID=UPI001CCE3363|nr:hypothetical protein [Kovacikia minuta]UBF29337.1 hypothetical protein K9N68_16765 [Kovacikia minuta CCNUW1]